MLHIASTSRRPVSQVSSSTSRAWLALLSGIFSLSHVLVGEGRGEGDFEFREPFVIEITLTLTLSHEYVGEGTRVATEPAA
jgi:hypothetical protein